MHSHTILNAAHRDEWQMEKWLQHITTKQEEILTIPQRVWVSKRNNLKVAD